jgi:hypothetical protein
MYDLKLKGLYGTIEQNTTSFYWVRTDWYSFIKGTTLRNTNSYLNTSLKK